MTLRYKFVSFSVIRLWQSNMAEENGIQLFAHSSRKRRNPKQSPTATKSEQGTRCKEGQREVNAHENGNTDVSLAAGSRDGTREASTSGQPTEAAEAATFKALGLSEWLCKIVHSLGMSKPTQVGGPSASLYEMPWMRG